MLFVAMVGLGCVASWTFSTWPVPLVLAGLVAFAGLIAAAYPLRRVLYHETWSFWSYLCFYPRVIVGLFGLLDCARGDAELSWRSQARGTGWPAEGSPVVLVLWNIRLRRRSPLMPAHAADR